MAHAVGKLGIGQECPHCAVGVGVSIRVAHGKSVVGDQRPSLFAVGHYHRRTGQTCTGRRYPSGVYVHTIDHSAVITGNGQVAITDEWDVSSALPDKGEERFS